MLTGVAGAGLMGSGIAAVLAKAGHTVRLYDTDENVLNGAVERLNNDGIQVESTVDLDELASRADFITEAIVENLEAKQDLFARLDRANLTAILATNTSVLPVTRIAEKASNQTRIVGTHWWNPPHLIPIVEVVRGEHTDDATMTKTTGILEDLGKTPVRVERDVPGFVGNRLQHALWREAVALVADGICTAETVDLVVRNTIGLRLGGLGPIANADFVGLDLTLAIHETVLPALNRDPHPSPLLRQLVADGRLGAKSGQGFLAWPPGSREETARRLAAHVANQLHHPDTEEV